MKYWLLLRRGESALCSDLVAQTSDLDLVRGFIRGLRLNWELEDDQFDTILDASFIASAPRLVQELNKAIRQAAYRQWPCEDDDDGEDDDDCEDNDVEERPEHV